MKKILLLAALLISLQAQAVLDSEFSGNIEGQVRRSKNNDEAKEELQQDWDQENFYLMYGNLNGKLELNHSRIEANWFARFSKSDLYDPSQNALGSSDPYFATNIFTFPNRLVARDLFRLDYKKQIDDYQTESVFNKFYYQWDYDGNRFMLGRMYINYGQGEIFNPINPFNQPTGLTSISQVAQGNDGMSFTFFVSNIHTIQFLFLGDKSFKDYDGRITRTVWAHGEYQASDKLQLDYVIGEDQERHKLGGQVSYRFEEAMIFSQILYQSENVKNKPSDNLLDILLGYDQQITSKWHTRFEGGYQKSDSYAKLTDLGERFLPTEYFAALANIYEIHPLVKLNGTVINDIKSGFTYFIAKGTYSMSQNIEAELFGYLPVAKGDEADNLAQKLVTTDVGLALRAFF
jgi:hypothetical protein